MRDWDPRSRRSLACVREAIRDNDAGIDSPAGQLLFVHEPIRETSHRLPPGAYKGQVSVSFTACVNERARLFTGPEHVLPLVTALSSCIEKHGCTAIYTFMPDHIHIIAGGGTDQSNPLSAMKCFKQKSGFYLASAVGPSILQKDFHDNILSDATEYDKAVLYLIMNPVRAGLVADWHDHPFTGSIGCELEDVVVGAMLSP